MMEIDSILSELRQNRGYFPREAVEEAIRRRAESAPHLLRAHQVGHPSISGVLGPHSRRKCSCPV